MIQASNYGDAPGADGYFLLRTRNHYESKSNGNGEGSPDLEAILGGVTYRGVLKVGKEPARPGGVFSKGIPEWLKDGIDRRPQPADPDEFLNAVQDMVEELAVELPLTGEWPRLFEHADTVLDLDSGKPEHSRRAAAYLLLDQIVFYRILQERGFPELKPAGLIPPST